MDIIYNINKNNPGGGVGGGGGGGGEGGTLVGGCWEIIPGHL